MRGPWLTSLFGLVLLIGIPIEFLTGLLSYAAYNPRLGNYPNPDHGLFGFYLFNGRKGRRGGGIATHPLPPWGTRAATALRENSPRGRERLHRNGSRDLVVTLCAAM